MSLWWLQPGWKEARCGTCGGKIWPEGDPDWGECYECFSSRLADKHRHKEPIHLCDICGKHESVTGTNGYGVCSEECHHVAEGKKV